MFISYLLANELAVNCLFTSFANFPTRVLVFFFLYINKIVDSRPLLTAFPIFYYHFTFLGNFFLILEMLTSYT